MPEVRIKTDFGEVVIPYTNLTELETGLADIDKVVGLVNSKVTGIVKKEPRKPKPGYEDLYRHNEEDLIELLKFPSSKLETIILTMFFHHPTPISKEALVSATGITTVPQYVANKKYEDLFSDVGRGQYVLQQKALDMATNQIIPKLREQTKIKVNDISNKE